MLKTVYTGSKIMRQFMGSMGLLFCAALHVFLTSVLVKGERSASRSGRFTAGLRTPGTHCVGS
jgi:hypothetical protein